MIRLKRAYEAALPTDGTRFLVERLWPRGVSKATLRVDAWLKEVAPSTELRKWFGHDPGKWREFRRRYFRELDARHMAWQTIVSAARHATVTLLYSSHDTEHNNAVALQEYMQAKSRRPATSKRASAAGRPASSEFPRSGCDVRPSKSDHRVVGHGCTGRCARRQANQGRA